MFWEKAYNHAIILLMIIIALIRGRVDIEMVCSVSLMLYSDLFLLESHTSQ